jgi:hypothetical protein
MNAPSFEPQYEAANIDRNIDYQEVGCAVRTQHRHNGANAICMDRGCAFVHGDLRRRGERAIAGSDGQQPHARPPSGLRIGGVA